MIGIIKSNIRLLIERFKADVEYRKLLLASFSSFLIRVFGMGFGFLVTLITSRYYGADALGIVSICFAILSFASIIGKLGMDVSLVRYISEYFHAQRFGAIKNIYLKAWSIMLPVSLILTLLLYFNSSFIAEYVFHKPHLSGILRLNSFFIIPLNLLLINSETIRSLARIRTYTFLQTAAVSVFVTAFLAVGLVWENTEVSKKYLPVYFQFISIVLVALISTVLWIRYSQWTRSKKEELAGHKKLMRTSSPMFITTLMQLVMTWTGTLVMAAYYSEAETGVYNAIVRISTFTNITIFAINSIAMPRLAATYASGNKEELRLLSQDAGRLIFLSTLPMFLALFLFPHFVLSLFGKDFPGHEGALMLLLAGQLFVSFAGLSAQILNMSDRERILRNNAVISAIINVGLCFALIPRYGLWGACIAQVAGMIAWNTLCIFSVRQHFGFSSFFTLKK